MQEWRDLFTVAHALSSAERGTKCSDFAPRDLMPGPLRYFRLREHGPVGATIFRMRIFERTSDRLIVDIWTARAVDPPLHLKIYAGGYRYLFLIDREDAGIWRYYAVTGLRGAGGAVATWFRNSYVNRAVAMFRYMTGIPIEQELPAAR